MPSIETKTGRRVVGGRGGAPAREERAEPRARRVTRVDGHGNAEPQPVAARSGSMAGRLPSWGELASAAGSGRAAKARANAFVESISTRKFVLLLLVLATAFALYVKHVHSTQQVLTEVQQLRRENLRLHLRFNRLKGEFDAATGPAVIYRRARALGMEEGFAYGPTIVVGGSEGAGESE